MSTPEPKLSKPLINYGWRRPSTTSEAFKHWLVTDDKEFPFGVVYYRSRVVDGAIEIDILAGHTTQYMSEFNSKNVQLLFYQCEINIPKIRAMIDQLEKHKETV